MQLEEFSKLVDLEATAIKNTYSNIDPNQLMSVYNELSQCEGYIVTMGCGTSGQAAKKITHTFNCVGISSYFLSPADAPHGAMGTLKKNDIVLLFSKGGETDELINIMDSLKKLVSMVITVTSINQSKLATSSDMILILKLDKEINKLDVRASLSTISTIAIFDALSVYYAKDFPIDSDDYLTIHPGGKVGKSLTEDENAFF